ncbi:porin [Paraglaciecola arctica]|uniref:Porin domain-containing protein n=1 Tax=Paraglaciecola arctica BSs20135 TaxID=493475 RepID=K6XLR9_9ALTE|nr:porin [Paraglaciecola arctica]GAC21609.1 hypothetical protein GARC_4667 [Paraglaciecola arctica BSs20135]
MKKLLTIAALTASTFTAQAEVRINGFANLIGGITSSDDTVYGYEDKISFSEESSFAIQITGDINEKMTATGQILARGEDDYEAKVAWAYMTYQATDKLSISAGRLRLPLFKYSASLDVGYSYHWVNAPRAVYDVEFNNIDGVRFDYSTYAGDWEYNTQLALGKITVDNDNVKFVANNTAVFSVEAVNDWFKARAVYGTSKVTLDSAAITEAISVLNDLGLTELYNNLAYENDTSPFLGLGLEVDKYDWFVSGEITILETEKSFNPKSDAYYVTAGLRLGKFTPSVTYENFDSKEYKFLDQVNALPLPDANKAGIEGLVRGLQEGSFNKHNVITLGLRYDFDTNVAFKTDLSRYDNKLNDAETTLLRVAVNYIF